MTTWKRIKSLMTTRRLWEVGTITSGIALMIWWLIPRLAQWVIDMKEGHVSFIAFGIEG